MKRQKIFDYVKKRYGTVPDFPWESDPDSAVLRHSGTKKWYALIMNVSARKLGMDSDEQAEVINVKCDPLLIGSLRKTPGFLPAYHMNKEQWLTILLDGSVSEKRIYELIDLSFDLTDKKRKVLKEDDAK